MGKGKKFLLFLGITLVIVVGLVWSWRYASNSPIPEISCERMQGPFRFHDMIVIQDADGIFRTKSSQYPGCDEKDIFVGWCNAGKIEGQIWAGCNIGSRVSARDTENVASLEKNIPELTTIVGEYFSWGKNRPSSLDGTDGDAPENLISSISTWVGLIPERTSDWSVNPKGPCRGGYHIPSQKDWEDAITHSDASIVTILGLPAGGFLGNSGSLSNLGEGYYWSTTRAVLGGDPFKTSSESDNTSSAYGLRFFDDGESVFTRTPAKKEGKFLIRCIQDSIE